MKKHEIINRILYAKEYLKFRTDADFADYLSINRSNFSQMIQGKRSIGDSILNKISIQADINKSWLLTGEGEMLNSNRRNKSKNIKVRCIHNHSIVESTDSFQVIDNNMMSLNDIGFVQGYIDRHKLLCAIVVVENRIKYCPIDGLEVL